MLIQITILIGLLIIWWYKKSTKPANFPPGPAKYPIFGSYFETLRPGEKRPNLFWSVRKFAKQYGTIFGFYLNNTPFIVLTDYEDIKEILKKDEIAGRSAAEPGNRFRPGWKSLESVEPGVNKGRNPGVIGTQVFINFLLKSYYIVQKIYLNKFSSLAGRKCKKSDI